MLVHLYQSRCSQYRPFVGALAVQRHLDNARFGIASGFMMVFLDYFMVDNTMNRADPSHLSVLWCFFKKNLWALFQPESYHNSSSWKLVQTYSTLELANNPKASNDADENTDEDVDKASERSHSSQLSINEPPEHSDLFQKFAHIPLSRHTTASVRDANRNDFVKHALNFFLPIFIWEYTKVKKLVVDVEKKIYDLHVLVWDNEAAVCYT